VFIVGNKYVVKFFGRKFNGQLCYQVELEAFTLFTQTQVNGSIFFPTLVATGTLYNRNELPSNSVSSWHWPYLITTFIEGIALHHIFSSLSYESKLSIASQLGKVVKALHAIPTPHSDHSQNWKSFVAFLQKRYSKCQAKQTHWNCLTKELIDQIYSYIGDQTKFSHFLEKVTRQPPVYVHSDLTSEHVLLKQDTNGEWTITGIIDFGDAKWGDPYFDLIPLHGLFLCDKELLKCFLASYGGIFTDLSVEEFTFHCMTYTLLFEFNVFDEQTGIIAAKPETKNMKDITQMAQFLWSLNK